MVGGIKEQIKVLFEKVFKTYSDDFKGKFGYNSSDGSLQPQSPLLLSKVSKEIAQELLPLIENIPDTILDKQILWVGFSSIFHYAYVLSSKVKEEEVKSLMDIRKMLDNDGWDKFLTKPSQIVEELKEIVGSSPTIKCVDCQQEKDNLLTIQKNNKDIKICQECKTKRDDNEGGNGFKCSKCGKRSNSSHGKGFINGINHYGYCGKCYYLVQEDTTCYKCRKNQRNGERGTPNWNFCAECLKEPVSSKKCCPECQKIVRLEIKQGQNSSVWEEEEWKDDGRSGGKRGEHCSWVCMRDASQRDPNNPHNNEYPCERCQTSTYSKEKGSYIRKRITHWYTDFRKTVNYFGMNCPCVEEFKKEHQQTCPHCNKKEWPDMAKGWMLDYEIKKAFCSPNCHVAYRKLSWEKVDQLTHIEMMPPELELSSGNRKDFDWEKEGNKKEILYWRESVKELQRQLEESKRKSPNQRNPNEVPHQARQIGYLLKLHQNSQQKSEQDYQAKYSKAELDALIGSNLDDEGDKGKGTSWGVIALIVIGVVALVGGIIFLLTRRNKKKIK